jgi:hypothetical protein
MRSASTRALLALCLAAAAPACSSTPPDNDSVGPPGDAATTCTVASLDAGFTTLTQVCGAAASPAALLQDACGPYIIVTRGTDTAGAWYFDAHGGALVAVVGGGTCTTTSASFASQWGMSAWGCATATPLCAASDASND